MAKSYFNILFHVPVLIYDRWVRDKMVRWKDDVKKVQFLNNKETCKFYYLESMVLMKKIISDKRTSNKWLKKTDFAIPGCFNVYDVELQVFVKDGVVCTDEQQMEFRNFFCTYYGIPDNDNCFNVYSFVYHNGTPQSPLCIE